MFPQHAFVTTGKDTADFREDYGIAKEHHLDAYCIACSVLAEPTKVAAPTGKPHRLMQFRRHDRQVCHKENIKRVYLSEGKAVATNRHKAIEQKDDSLEEFRKTHTQQEVSALTVKDHQPVYMDMRRFMPGGVFLFNGKVHTLQRSHGRYKWGCHFTTSTQMGARTMRKDVYSYNKTVDCAGSDLPSAPSNPTMKCRIPHFFEQGGQHNAYY